MDEKEAHRPAPEGDAPPATTKGPGGLEGPPVPEDEPVLGSPLGFLTEVAIGTVLCGVLVPAFCVGHVHGARASTRLQRQKAMQEARAQWDAQADRQEDQDTPRRTEADDRRRP